MLGVATGAGKTVIFIKLLTELLTPGTRGLILAHREELIEQPIERLRRRRWWLMDGSLDRPRVGRLLGGQKTMTAS